MKVVSFSFFFVVVGCACAFQPTTPVTRISRTDSTTTTARYLTSYQQFIDGNFVDSTSTGKIEVENPSTNELLCVVPEGTAQDAELALAAAKQAQRGWADTPACERGAALRKLSDLIEAKRDDLAALLAAEQAKIMPLSEIEIDASVEYLRYYAGLARSYEGEILQSDNPKEQIYLHRVPLGVSCGIIPWNFPIFVMMRKIAPALLTGNTVVCKTSELTPITSFEIAKLLNEAGIPPGVVNVVTGYGSSIGQALVESPVPDIISMTGSVATGKKIMAAAANNVCKVNLELGGKAPSLIMADCDIDLAVQATWSSRTIFSGQVCNCAERSYVQRPVYDEFVEKLAAKMKETTVGATPDAPNADMCGLVSGTQLTKVQGMVERAVQAGAEVVTGGGLNEQMGDKGYHFSPTVLTNVQQSDEIVQKEVFGPVLPVLPFDDLEEALELANDSEYGLTSSIFTKSAATVHKAMKGFQFGETYINRHNFEAIQGYHAGWRKSGIGGTDGKHGLHEYLATRCVYWQEE